MSTIVVQAPAKINIGLEVLGRRVDGFHEIRTILQTVSIYDRLTLSPAPTVALSCSKRELANADNLVHRAVKCLREQCQVSQGAQIHIEKTIPTAAGLGGASSDAAAALRGASTLWSLSCSNPDVSHLASRLGSDVPFFLHGGTVLAEGRGDRLTPLPPLGGVWFVVASPRVELPNKTPRMYSTIQPRDFSDGASVTALASGLEAREAVDWREVINRFDFAATHLIPEIAGLRDAFRRAGSPVVLMTGAGPSHYTAIPDFEQAASIHARLTRDIGAWAELFLCQPIAAVPAVEMV